MKSQQLSPFDQAMKEFGLVLFAENSGINESTKGPLLSLLGKLTFARSLTNKERESDPMYQFSIEDTMHRITQHVKSIDSLKQVWDQTRPIFIQLLL